jgi:hypothetical protein
MARSTSRNIRKRNEQQVASARAELAKAIEDWEELSRKRNKISEDTDLCVGWKSGSNIFGRE